MKKRSTKQEARSMIISPVPPLIKGGKGGFFLFLVSCLLFLSACGDGGMYTNQSQQESLSDDNSAGISCSTEAKCSVQITRNAFLFGSDYPADIVIPDIDGMRNTAFVVTGSNPTGVVAIDLATNPLSVSRDFNGLATPAGTGYPSSLFIMSAERAFLLTSSHVIDFNQATGAVNKSQPLNYTITLQNPMPLSDSSATVDTINLTYPSSVAVANSQLYITTSNYINPLSPAVAAPGTVIVFDILDSEPFLKIRTYILTSDYNPTGITPLHDGTIVVTNSGVSDLVETHAEPKTNSSIDIITPATNTVIANIPVGTVGLSFQKMAVTKDGRRGFIGSISYGEIYEIDLEDYKAVRDHSSPIVVTGTEIGSDYLTAQVLSFDDAYLFVSSFNNSAVYPIDITSDPPKALPGHFTAEPFIIGFASGVTAENPSGTNTGAGALSIRPGVPSEDFSGPDIFVVTGFPGTLAAINTNYAGGAKLTPDETPPPENPPPMENKPEEPKEPPPPQENLPADTSNTSITLDPSVLQINFAELFAKKLWPVFNLSKKEKPNTCKGFASAIVDIKISSGGGFGFSKLPGVVLGHPEPPANDAAKEGAYQSVDVLSLGAGGGITLDMGECEIVDGEGPDFIVFENAFFYPYSAGILEKATENSDGVLVYSEPAEVGVSEDNTTYHTFPCNVEMAVNGTYGKKLQSGCAGITPTLYGKDPLVAGLLDGAGGDAFDLAKIGLKKARYVRITDVGTYKSPADPDNPGEGNAGFDLDAIAVVNGNFLIH